MEMHISPAHNFTTVVSMYGGLQGTVGKSLQEIEGLELQELSFSSATQNAIFYMDIQATIYQYGINGR